MKYVVTVWEAVMEIYLSSLPKEADKSLFIDADDLAPLGLPKMQDQSSLTYHWCSFSWCGREYAATSLAIKGGQYSVYESLQPFTTPITKDTKPKIVQALLTFIFKMGRELVIFSLSIKGGQYSIYDSPQPFLTLISKDPNPTIVDALLMVIFMYCLVKMCWQ